MQVRACGYYLHWTYGRTNGRLSRERFGEQELRLDGSTSDTASHYTGRAGEPMMCHTQEIFYWHLLQGALQAFRTQ
jgi:hypothetical protein